MISKGWISCLIIFIFLFFNSCAYNTKLNQSYKIKKTFVKMDVSITLVRCVDNQCQSMRAGSVASGAGVKYAGKTHILTANHVCDYNDIVGPAMEAGYTPKIAISAIDVTGQKYVLKIIKQNTEADLCLLSGENLNISTLKLSGSPPEKNEKYYNFAAPAGIFNPGVVPLYEGRYAGLYYGIYALYTIPVYPGSSGSPVVNSDGELVGMIHSVHRNFHHISFSATYKQISVFLSDAKSEPEFKLFIIPIP